MVVADLDALVVQDVWCGGRLAASGGTPLAWSLDDPPTPPTPTMHVDLDLETFRIRAREGEVRVIEAIPDQIVTGHLQVLPSIDAGEVVSDPSRDLLKIAVVERHRGSGNVGLGLVRGMGLTRGALAGTVAHDHHNVLAVGADDRSMRTAVDAIAQTGGGFAVAEGGEVIALLPLPVGGLMSTAPIEDVREAFDAVVAAARELGSPLHDPFMALSFLGLEVIPSLKITDKGLVDVEAFQVVDLWVGESP